jgi:hypothetical protein
VFGADFGRQPATAHDGGRGAAAMASYSANGDQRDVLKTKRMSSCQRVCRQRRRRMRLLYSLLSKHKGKTKGINK